MDLIRRLFTAALVAGVLSGTAASVVQQTTTVPLILEAEKYEVVTPPPAPATANATASTAAPAGHEHAAPVRQLGEGVPESDAEAFQRLWTTVVSNVIAGVGYALVIAGVMLLMGQRVDARRGLLWGIGGFVAFSLAPSVGLPPELPGMAGADLAARQIWWLAAALCAGGGMLAVAFAKNRLLIGAAVVLAALPHLVGAPHPESPEGAFPPELAAHFVTSALGTSALFWALLGAVCGAMMGRVIATAHDEP
ncbi:CbtA family protein [Azospirillum doebereinerae]